MAVKFRHKETGLFWCRAKGRSPSRNEYYEGSYIPPDPKPGGYNLCL